MELKDIGQEVKRTHLIIALDESGSMGAMWEEAMGGFNKLLEEQAGGQDKVTVSLYTFSNSVRKVFSFVPLENVQHLTRETYKPQGLTALYDAIGRAIAEDGSLINELPAELKPGLVCLVIITDGQNNSSIQWDAAKVRDAIKAQEGLGWVVTYLGCDPSSMNDAANIGVAAAAAMSFDASGGGLEAAYASTAGLLGRARGLYATGSVVTADSVGYTAEERTRSSTGK